MTWTTITETGLTGIDGMLLYANFIWSGFFPFFLVILFLIVLLASYFAEQRLKGSGDFWASWTVAGILTTIIALIGTMITQTVESTTYVLVNGLTLSICFVFTIIGAILFLTSRDRY